MRRAEISLDTARILRKNLNLHYHSSFTNTEPSELCSEYHVQTGYALLGEDYEFLRLTTTKDENGIEITKYEIFEKELEE